MRGTYAGHGRINTNDVNRLQRVTEDVVSVMPGMGPDAPITTNEKGGSQSELLYRFDLIDTTALFQLANLLHHGAVKYGDSNWHDISVNDHINHAMSHIVAYMHGDTTDDHLTHAFCRLMMAIGVQAKTDNSEEVRAMVERYIR